MIRTSSSTSWWWLLLGLAAVISCGTPNKRDRQDHETSTEAGQPSSEVPAGGVGAMASVGGATATPAGAGGYANAGAEGFPTDCPELPDPQLGCPASSPTVSAACQKAALCDYDTCGEGCFDLLVCPEDAAQWAGSSRVCGGACDASLPSDEPWSQARRLTFARASGDCGALGSLDYNSDTNQLGALSCSVALDEQSGCVWRRLLDCALEKTQISIEAKVAFRAQRGWRGQANVAVSGDAPCDGTYLLAL